MRKGERTAAKDKNSGKEMTLALAIQCWHDCRGKLTGKLEKCLKKKCWNDSFAEDRCKTLSESVHDRSLEEKLASPEHVSDIISAY